MAQSHELTAAREYLARAIPWPQEGDEPAFVNIQWTFVPNDGKVRTDSKGKPLYPWAGKACRSVAEAVSAVDWALKSPGTRDIYACLSSQRTAKERQAENGRVWYSAIRNQENAVALKSLFIDIDAKGSDQNSYNDLPEAMVALGQFIEGSGMPRPTMCVSSGGGLHVYWVMARAIMPYEWQPLAFALAEATKKHGLKCDTQCTVDSARVLRVPNTFNRKTDEARPVRFVGTRLDFDYSVERLGAALEPYRTMEVIAPILPPRGALPGLNDELTGGIEVREFRPIDLQTIVLECGFVRDALMTGGQAFANPLWNLTTFLSTFCEDGRMVAHLMARKHPGYSKESTDELFDRKNEERERRNLGWPSCQGISGAGATMCQSCPHFGKGKSPLNFATSKPPVQTALPLTTSPSSTDPLPPDYQRRPDGVVTQMVTDPTGQAQWIPVCDYPITNGWLQRNPWILHFSTVMDNGRKALISLHAEDIGTNEMRKVLQGQGLVVNTDELKPLARFFVSWVKTLQQTANAVVSSSPFGWDFTNGKVSGFCYGGNLWTPSGSRAAANADPQIAQQYAPTGDIQPWVNASALVTSQGRPDLDAIIASSFAAPLVLFTGHTGLQMSAYSVESGIGKSTALKVAQSVWGDPIRGIQSLGDTQNSVFAKLGELQSLPIFWDELKTDEDTKRFVNLTFQLTGGKEKSRLNTRIAQRPVGKWQTILVSASNDSLLDMVLGKTKTTTAGLLRIFEYEVRPGTKGQIDPTRAQSIVAKLNHNYGAVGMQYAQWLGANFSTLEAEVMPFCEALGKECGYENDERFWVALVGSLLLGAKYANKLGYTSIDEVGLKTFLLDVLEKMRGERKVQPVDMKDAMNVSNILAQFLNWARARHTLYTNKIHTAPGRPKPGDITLPRDVTRLEAVYVHIGLDDKIMRISSTALSEWLATKEYSRHVLTKALTDQFGMRNVRARIGAGTSFAGAFEYLLEIDLSTSQHANFIDET